MSRGRPMPHFEHVDIHRINSCFFENRTHRAYLKIPFCGNRGDETLCVIGQNPSAADEYEADKTINYLEQLIYCNYEQYHQLIIVNLYSFVDTKKAAKNNILNSSCDAIFNNILEVENNFLMVCGKLTNQEPYCFLDRVRLIKPILQSKNVFKLNVGAQYAPHPGNPQIFYNNMSVKLSPYRFEDI